LLAADVTLIAGDSAHVFHGVASRVLYDLGDFLDDYRIDWKLRNDLGLLFLVDLAGSRVEAIPLKLEFAHTRFADGDDAAWIRRRFAHVCRDGRNGGGWPPRFHVALALALSSGTARFRDLVRCSRSPGVSTGTRCPGAPSGRGVPSDRRSASRFRRRSRRAVRLREPRFCSVPVRARLRRALRTRTADPPLGRGDDAQGRGCFSSSGPSHPAAQNNPPRSSRKPILGSAREDAAQGFGLLRTTQGARRGRRP